LRLSSFLQCFFFLQFYIFFKFRAQNVSPLGVLPVASQPVDEGGGTTKTPNS